MAKEKTTKVSEETEATEVQQETKNEEIHVPGYNKETHEEEKVSFWQSAKFQWIIWIVGVFVIGGIFLFQWLNTYPSIVNPTKSTITVNIDDKTFTIAAGKAEEAKISHGKHTVSMDGKEMGTFEFGWFDGASIINPTMSRFVEEEVIYTTSGNPEKYYDKVTLRELEIDGEIYEKGPYRLIEPTLYLKKTWDYAPWEGSPSEITTKGRSDYVIKKELHYIDDFKAMFE